MAIALANPLTRDLFEVDIGDVASIETSPFSDMRKFPLGPNAWWALAYVVNNLANINSTRTYMDPQKITRETGASDELLLQLEKAHFIEGVETRRIRYAKGGRLVIFDAMSSSYVIEGALSLLKHYGEGSFTGKHASAFEAAYGLRRGRLVEELQNKGCVEIKDGVFVLTDLGREMVASEKWPKRKLHTEIAKPHEDASSHDGIPRSLATELEEMSVGRRTYVPNANNGVLDPEKLKIPNFEEDYNAVAVAADSVETQVSPNSALAKRLERYKELARFEEVIQQMYKDGLAEIIDVLIPENGDVLRRNIDALLLMADMYRKVSYRQILIDYIIGIEDTTPNNLYTHLNTLQLQREESDNRARAADGINDAPRPISSLGIYPRPPERIPKDLVPHPENVRRHRRHELPTIELGTDDKGHLVINREALEHPRVREVYPVLKDAYRLKNVPGIMAGLSTVHLIMFGDAYTRVSRISHEMTGKFLDALRYILDDSKKVDWFLTNLAAGNYNVISNVENVQGRRNVVSIR